MTSLPPLVSSSLEEVLDKDFNIVAYTLNKIVPVDELEAGIVVINELSKPMERKEIGLMIVELFSLTKRRKEDQLTLNMVVEAYGLRLGQYPADIVREVLTKWPDQSMWWPAWHELKEEIDWRNKRAKMKAALEKKLAPDRTQSVINQAIRKG